MDETGRDLIPLALSCGDPAGIGPEIVAEAWNRRKECALPPFVLCGGGALVGELCLAQPVRALDEAADVFDSALPVLTLDDADLGDATPGRPTENSARYAAASLERACREAIEGRASGIVTAPVSKSALYSVGFSHSGQTEYVAERAGAQGREVMMLAGPSLKVVPITIHVPLAEVPALLTRDLIERTGRTVAAALVTDFGIEAPRLAIAGLNPHAGEGGAIGREELDVIAPAVSVLRGEGIAIDGPLPADSLFHAAARAQYDAVLCPTHDQALIPIKALHFDDAVNMTLGLPVVRTSPDHGTAFSIAGKGVASAGSMIAALRMAGEVAHRRRAAGV